MSWGNKPRPVLNKRAAARFAAVQALYQIDLTGAPAATVADEFQRHRLAAILEPLELEVGEPKVDVEFFRRLVLGAWDRREALDAALEGALAQGWTLERGGYPLRALLRAAAFELAACPDIPLKVALNEYVEMAKLFLTEGEPGFVNAVLDELAPKLRAGADAAAAL